MESLNEATTLEKLTQLYGRACSYKWDDREAKDITECYESVRRKLEEKGASGRGDEGKR